MHSNSDAERPAAPEPERAMPCWQRLRIGILPLPLYLLAAATVIAMVLRGKVSSDLCIMAVVLAVCSYALAEIGHRIPGLRSIGGPVILNTFLPSAMVFYGVLPEVLNKAITRFYHQSNFLYLFVTAVVAGSIFAMDRRALLANMLKIFAPLTLASLAAALVGLLVGLALGLSPAYLIFFVLTPIMAGGVGEGAVPLAIGYAAINHASQAEMLGKLLPIVAMANVCAIVAAGLLNAMGLRRPDWSGQGQLLHADERVGTMPVAAPARPLLSDPVRPATTGLALLTLYATSSAVEHIVRLPAPLIMLLLAVVLKMARLIPESMEQSAQWIYRFFAAACTYPLMFCIGVVLTPWKPLVAAFSPAICITIAATVLALAGTGFLLARRLRMYPVEAAIIMACHASSGGAGDVAILSAGQRLGLMASAQVATKIGGFVTVTLALLAYACWH
ncbi:2-hydroxycarboxylate transporter family protein [Frateuria aurantia]